MEKRMEREMRRRMEKRMEKLREIMRERNMERRILIARRAWKNVGAPANANDPQIDLGEVQLYKEVLNPHYWCFSQNNQVEVEEKEEEVVEEEGVSKLVPVWDMCRGCPAPGRNLIQF